jgi:hypothetical protein
MELMKHNTTLPPIPRLARLTGWTYQCTNDIERTIVHKTFWRLRRSRPKLFAVLVGARVLCPAVVPVRAQESSDIAKQAQNPIASLISVPFESDFSPQTGINKQDS